MDFDLARIQSEIAEAIGGAGTDIQISWREWPAGTTIDPITQSKIGPTVDGEVLGPTERTMVVKGMIHFPEPRANSQVVQFNEIELGDCIVDFQENVALDAPGGGPKEAVTLLFLDRQGKPIDGQKWVPKPTPERLAKTWGLIVCGVKLLRPVLLRKAT